jgi:hypothetical protein
MTSKISLTVLPSAVKVNWLNPVAEIFRQKTTIRMAESFIIKRILHFFLGEKKELIFIFIILHDVS